MGGQADGPAPTSKVYSASCVDDASVQRLCTVLGRRGQRDECTYTVPHINNGARELGSVPQSKRGRREPVKMYLWPCATFAGSGRYPSLFPGGLLLRLWHQRTSGLCCSVWLAFVSLRDGQRGATEPRECVLYLAAPSCKWCVVCVCVSVRLGGVKRSRAQHGWTHSLTRPLVLSFHCSFLSVSTEQSREERASANDGKGKSNAAGKRGVWPQWQSIVFVPCPSVT